MDHDTLRLADAIYEAALEPALWPDTLSRISSQFGAIAATISAPDSGTGLLFAAGHETPFSDYMANWRHLDIIKDAVEKVPDGLYCDWKMLTSHQMNRSSYYQEFRRKYGVRHIVGLSVTLEKDQKFRFALQLPENKAPSEDSFLVDFGAIARQVSRSFGFSFRMRPEWSFRHAFGDEVFRTPHPAAVLDESARVVIANDRFASLARDGLDVVDGRLRCANAKDQVLVDNVLRAAVLPNGGSGPSLAVVSRPSQKRPFVVKATRLSQLHRDVARADGLKAPHALLLVLDLNGEGSSDCGENLRILGLTRSECRVAHLVGSGLSPREIALRLGLTEGTIRTCLKGMFSKLGLSRQSEITHIVTRIQMFVGTA